MSLVLPVVDELRAGLPVPTGASRNDDAAPPIHRQPKTLYVWAVEDAYDQAGTGDGSLDESTMRLRVEYCHAPAGEEASSDRDRQVSVDLDDAAGAIVAWFRQGHRKGTTYEWALVDRVTLDTVRTLDFRGFAVDLRLGRLQA